MSRARRALTAALVAATGLVPVVALTPTAQAATPAPQRLISGWLPYWSLNTAKTRVIANGDLVNIASPFWYRATSATTIAKQSGAGNATVVADLHKRGIKVVPTVTDGMTPAALVKNLNSASWRKSHVTALVNLAVANKYDGLDLDYEGIAFGSTRAQRPALRTGFTALVSDLSKAMHARKKTVTLAVAATTADSPVSAAYVYNYAALGKTADKIRVMAYDYSWAGGAAGPIAPVTWVKRVMAYTTSVVPKAKVQTGVPLYGYDWGKKGTRATALSYSQAVALMKSKKATRKWDSSAQSPYFTYKDAKKVTHTVHYMDAAAVLARLNLTKSLGANGITVWAFGQEDPAMWSAVRGASKAAAAKKPAPKKPAAKKAALAPAVKVTTRWSTKSVKVGTKPTLTVYTSKASAGRTARREQYVNGKWYLIATAKLNKNGAYAFKVTTTSKGRKAYRVVLPATSKAKASYAATTYLTVR